MATQPGKAINSWPLLPNGTNTEFASVGATDIVTLTLCQCQLFDPFYNYVCHSGNYGSRKCEIIGSLVPKVIDGIRYAVITTEFAAKLLVFIFSWVKFDRPNLLGGAQQTD